MSTTNTPAQIRPNTAGATAAPPISPQQAVEQSGEKTVTMMFPQAVTLTTNDHQRISFTPGVHQVPESLASHEYLRLNGAKIHQPATSSQEEDWTIALPPASAVTTLTPSHLEFLQSRGFGITMLTDAQAFFDRLNPKQKEKFLSESSAWSTSNSTAEQATRQRQLTDAASGSTQAAPGGPEPKTPADVGAAGANLGAINQRATFGNQPNPPTKPEANTNQPIDSNADDTSKAPAKPAKPRNGNKVEDKPEEKK